jgi:Kef-type K+ transport system membrane component KefB
VTRRRAWAELVLAVLAAVVGIVTAVFPTWFEALFEASPDEGSGALELAVSVALIATSVVLSLLARRDFRRARGSTGEI